MAVQKSKKSRSKRGMRRSHHAISGMSLTQEQATGATRLRHHMSADGFYRGRQIIDLTPVFEDDEDSEGE